MNSQNSITGIYLGEYKNKIATSEFKNHQLIRNFAYY